MRAIILAAGFGSRLRPLTDSTPKCLVTIKGKEILGIWLDSLFRAKVYPVLVNTHYLSHQVEAYVKASVHRSRVQLVYEPTLLGTAGTLMANLHVFNGNDGFLIHADNYCGMDLQAFINAHNQRPKQCQLTMLTFQSDDPSTCGIVEIDKYGVVVGFHEKVASPPGNLANGAVYILSADLIAKLRTTHEYAKDFSSEILPDLLGRIYSFHTTDKFFDIGTPKNYFAANSE